MSSGELARAVIRVGISHHLGWAVAVTSDADHAVVDRRRIELVGVGLPAAPIHQEGGAHALHRSGPPLDDGELEELAERVRRSALLMAAQALGDLETSVTGTIRSISLRAWPADFPTDIATLRCAPYESRADSVMYRQVLAAEAERRGWKLDLYDAKGVEQRARDLLGSRAAAVLDQPRQMLGPPWNKDHRTALAATVLAG